MNINLNPFAERRAEQRYTHAGMPVDILQLDWEFKELLKLYVERSPNTVLEIGTRWGGTLWHWLSFGLGHVVNRSVTALDMHFETPAQTMQQWAPPGVTLHLLEGDSCDAEIVKRVWDTYDFGVDWLFIDGDHSYEGVLADFNNYARLVKPGGVLALHDITAQPNAQVDRLWAQIRKAGHVTREIVADPNSQGSGIGVVLL